MNTDISRVGFSPQSAMPLAGAKPPVADTPKTSTVGSATTAEHAPLVDSNPARLVGHSGAKPVSRIQTMEADQQAAKADAKKAEAQQAELQAALERLNRHMRENARAIEFSIDDVTDRTIITVRQKDTGEVIRQIPSDGLLEFAHQVEEQLQDTKGLLWNAKI
jgi:flagellar protein FlaG